VADDINNSLIIQGSAADYEYLLETIKRMDVLPRQAIIDARIFEIDLTDALSFGVSATLQAQTPGQQQLTTGSIDASTGALSASSFAFVGSSREILMALNALRQKTKVRILEAPSLLVIDGQMAHIQVGGQVPIPGGTFVSAAGGATTSVQYANTGTELEITPRISASGVVTLQVSQGVTAVGAGSALGPTFSTTNVLTTLAVKDGESVAIAGLIRESDSSGRSGVPFLSDIPVLGALFGRTNRSATRTELLIMITPHVIRTPERFREMSEQLKDSLRNAGKYADQKQKEIKDDQEKAFIERLKKEQEQMKKSDQGSVPPPPIKKQEEPTANLGPQTIKKNA
jgi:general secretion pathway protein D